MKQLILAAGIAILGGSVHATTFDFTGDICNGGNVCTGGFGNVLDQSYGDTAGANVTYDGDIATAGIQDTFHWGTGYEDFATAIWTNVGDGLSITIDANAGFDVTLSSFGFAPFLNRTSNTQVRVTELVTGSVLFDQTYNPLSTSAATFVAPATPWTSSFGFTIQLGPDAFNAGIGEFTYTTSPNAAIPLPAGGLLLIAGLGGLAALRRNRMAA